MNKYIAIVLLSIFTICNLAINYGIYKKGMEMSFAMMEEEDETHHLEVLVKKILKSEEHPFEIFEINEYKTDILNYFPVKTYEDVCLSSVEAPPDFMC